MTRDVVVVHADESCLGNQLKGPRPGGGGALLERRRNGAVQRRDLYISSRNSTNNQMALAGAIAAFHQLLALRDPPPRILYVSDSQYLVKGMRDWIHAWKARGWRRKGGAIENLDLWRQLDDVLPSGVTFHWVRGHAGDPKNEYADHLAVRAAEDQSDSAGLVKSGFGQWLTNQQEDHRYEDFDPDAHFDHIIRDHM